MIESTSAQIHFESAQSMKAIKDDSVDLIVTSPPYPMIEMWDQSFAQQNPSIGEALQNGEPQEAHRLMHCLLKEVWVECYRVLDDGGIMCINIGDATRNIQGYQLFPNHTKIVEQCRKIGLRQLPGILWRKPANSPSKFLGSGMLGLNAYVTLEHEHILVFRKGANRKARDRQRDLRYESAYFWEERNDWFTDVWNDLRGVSQTIKNGHADLRERSASFPLELPTRLIHMYSIYGDTVLDPFWGVGTTSVAAAALGRNSIGYEIDENFWSLFEEQAQKVPATSRNQNQKRIEQHIEFERKRNEKGKFCKYEAENYSFGVTTSQEQEMKFYDATEVERLGDCKFGFSYAPHRLDAQKELLMAEVGA